MKYIFKEKILAIIYLIGALANAFITSFLMVYVMDKTCSAVEIGTQSSIVMSSVRIIAFLLLSFTVMIIYSMVKNKFVYSVIADIREDVYVSVLKRGEADYFDDNTSNYINIYTKKLEQVEKYYVSLFSLIIAVGSFVGNFIFSINKNIIMTIVLVVMGMVTTFIPVLLKKRLGNINEEYMAKWETFISMLNGSFSNYREIRIYKKLPYIKRKFDSMNAELKNKGEKVAISIFNVGCIIMILIMAIQYFMVIICGYFIMIGKLPSSFLLVAIVLSGNITGSIQDITENITNIVVTIPIYKEVLQYTDIPSEELERNKKMNLESIKLKGVSFTYPNTEIEVLKNVNIEINKGDFIVLKGESGSGKSTLLKLLMGYYPISSGEICVNGEISLDKLDIYNDMYAVIFQEVNLFEDSIYNNITLFQNMDEKDVINAAIQAGLGNLLNRLPDGIYSSVEENGKNLSGGERQRISIARAILSKRNIFILDEATSNLDEQTAKEIERQIIDIPNSTVVMITHRMFNSTIERSNVIYEINNGEVKMINKRAI